MSDDILTSLKIIIVTFIFSVLITFLMKRLAHHIGAIDVPRSDEGNRHIHKKATPLLGGLGVFLAFMLSFEIVVLAE